MKYHNKNYECDYESMIDDLLKENKTLKEKVKIVASSKKIFSSTAGETGKKMYKGIGVDDPKVKDTRKLKDLLTVIEELKKRLSETEDFNKKMQDNLNKKFVVGDRAAEKNIKLVE